MPVACPHCSNEIEPTDLFCPWCGAKLKGGKAAVEPPGPPIGERAGELKPGYVLRGRYRIEGLLGRGGMGAVYRAEDLRLPGKAWAVKEMTEAGLESAERVAAVQNFEREAHLLAQLQHPNLPQVADFFEDGDSGRHYLVMDFIEGQTLEEVLLRQGNPFPEGQVNEWAFQLCDVLGYLHAENPPIVFRDLKPGNIMIEPNGLLKLIDFGIARFFKGDRSSDTQTFGTFGYAPPEQFGLGQTDARSDIYSLGVTLLRLATGYDPAIDPFNLPPARQVNPAVSPRLEKVIQRATRQEPAARYRSAVELRDALSAKETKTFPWLPVAAGMAILVVVLGVLLMTTGGKNGEETPEPTLEPTAAVVEVVDTPTATPSPSPTATSTATPTPPATPTSSPSPEYGISIMGRDGLRMLLVPAGKFTMGSTSDQVSAAATLCSRHPDGDSCRREEFLNEVPQRAVYVSAFYMDETEVTNGEYQVCVDAGACSPPDQGTGKYRRSQYYDRAQYVNYPVVFVTWYDAQDYCQWAGERLPTEAEWEKAARGTDGRIFPWGDNFDTGRANTQDRGREEITQVGSYPAGASPYGILDMAGNTWEYVADWFEPNYYATAPDRDPQGPASSPSGEKVLRSGSYANFQHYARNANRGAVPPATSTQFRGIRCVVDAGN